MQQLVRNAKILYTNRKEISIFLFTFFVYIHNFGRSYLLYDDEESKSIIAKFLILSQLFLNLSNTSSEYVSLTSFSVLILCVLPQYF